VSSDYPAMLAVVSGFHEPLLGALVIACLIRSLPQA
jgi:hypothetical protein